VDASILASSVEDTSPSKFGNLGLGLKRVASDGSVGSSDLNPYREGEGEGRGGTPRPERDYSEDIDRSSFKDSSNSTSSSSGSSGSGRSRSGSTLGKLADAGNGMGSMAMGFVGSLGGALGAGMRAGQGAVREASSMITGVTRTAVKYAEVGISRFGALASKVSPDEIQEYAVEVGRLSQSCQDFEKWYMYVSVCICECILCVFGLHIIQK
jgi:hypothetical protein